MKLYLTAAGQYAGTQKEAGKGFKLEIVPDRKEDLIAYLNALKASAAPAPAPVDEDDEPEVERPQAVRSAPTAFPFQFKKAPAPDDGTEALVDWLFDVANPRQIADIFSALGTRFSETLRAQRETA